MTNRQFLSAVRIVGCALVLAGCPNFFANYFFGDGVRINPFDIRLLATSDADFTAFDGVEPYAFSIKGIGTIDSASGLYTAPAFAGFATVSVIDAAGATDSTTVTVDPLPALVINPAAVLAYHNDVISFEADGGLAPYGFSLESGGGAVSVSPTGGSCTAPTGSTTAVIRLTDAVGTEVDATAQIVAPGSLIINPPTAAIDEYGAVSFAAMGGAPAYTFSILSGPGSVDPGTGAFTPAGAGVTVVRVTDTFPSTADASVTAAPATPTNLFADGGSAGPSGIRLTWDDNSLIEGGYKLERKVDPGAFVEIASLAADQSNFVDNGLSGGTIYHYRARAFGNGVNSLYSNESAADPDP